ncbi:cell division protein ZipA C-terminal FtsZ-binding domain-containing protein [Cobetia sp. L2A1]|uniref:cell division protein ZipA C-terminal FtsZ-binding domain-containing protein n=1 Tax=Cobetia sp. L2A1 TaxID=2686360 RepID=UPI00131AA8C9|nr:cell division protein ZipA C-terminal FtsZ-binding domain-containing protein [Cobetia sp. L2A1]
MELREWLILLGLVLVAIIVVDGVRRLQRQRRVPRLDRVGTTESTDAANAAAAEEVDDEIVEKRDNWELPNGGYRVIGDAEQHDEAEDDDSVLDNAHGIKASRVTQPSRPAERMERREAPERKGLGQRAAAFGARASQSMRDVTASLGSRREDEDAGDNVHREPALHDEKSKAADHDAVSHDHEDGPSISASRADNLEPMAETPATEASTASSSDTSGVRATSARKEPVLEGQSASSAAATADVESEAVDERHPLVIRAERNKVDDALARDMLADASEVIIISVMARGDSGFSGEDVLGVSLACGLRHSNMGLFMRHEEDDDGSPLQFAMANVVKPGIFDPAEMVDSQLDGVTFLMPLPGADDTSAAFETMVEIAMLLVRRLGGELKDENHSVMTAQTIEFKRQQVHEFERRNRLHRYQAN